MTREQNFRLSFINQLVSYSSWQNISRTEIKKLPLSSFPAFTLDLGKTKYAQFDPAGKALCGEQEFSVTVYYELPLRSNDTAYLDHSDIMNTLEQFINDPIYIPPPILIGETCSINRTMMIESKAPFVVFGETRFAVSVTGKYSFTIF